ncbi:MAG TPA: caspase family protein [Thermoleophilaceae bacterium]
MRGTVATGTGDGADGPRLALLIGIEKYTSDDFGDLPTVPLDLERLKEVLEMSSYEVDVRTEGLGPDQIDGHLTAFLTRPEAEGATVVIYLSGHGLHVEGNDYLVPASAYSRMHVESNTQLLVNTDLRSKLQGSKASLVVLFVDACRENVKSDRKAVATPAYGAHLAEKHHPRLVTVFGCEPHGYCHFREKELNASIFAEALCKSFHPGTDARTVRGVIEAAGRQVEELVAHYLPGREQRVNRSYETSVSADVLDREICAGTPDPWAAAVEESPLWKRSTEEPDPELVRAVTDTARSAWRLRDTALEARADPWSDRNFPIRCLENATLLLGPEVQLHPAEVAMLVAAPFVREAMFATGILHFLPGDRDDTSSEVREQVDAACQLFPRLDAKRRRLPSEESHAVKSWLIHRAILRRVELWEDPKLGALTERLGRTVDVPIKAKTTGRQLQALAMHVAAGRDELQRESDSDRPELEPSYKIVRTDGRQIVLRSKALAALLALAGQLAVDPRLLSDVVPSHLDPQEDLHPEDLMEVLDRQVFWSLDPGRRTLTLNAACPHPAIHLALQEQLGGIEELLDQAQRLREESSEDLVEPIAGLPYRIDGRGLQPVDNDDGGKRYETPLLTFRLAHNEIRDLLMGVRLYGDPALAIRELYQNALDACRYRKARSAYRNVEYRGLIQFRQGEAGGRPFIECEDNGVGMGKYELEQVFSRAGRRFVHTPEFLWERAKWRRERPDIELWPNSQFGIGVFSYFMLADEIEIATARVSRRSLEPSEVLDVHISSSGSLFRIRRIPREGHGGGTTVRLYLRAPEESESDADAGTVSCIETLHNLLRYSEFDVTCEEGGKREEWIAGRLKVPDLIDRQIVPVRPDTWLVERGGGLLADGLRTGVERAGYVVDLRGPHQPTLSVDRTTMESWDEEWVQRAVREGVQSFPRDAEIGYRWLWHLTIGNPTLGQSVWEELAERGYELEAPSHTGLPARISVRMLGCFPLDERLLDWRDGSGFDDWQSLRLPTEDPERLGAARLRALGSLGLVRESAARHEAAKTSKPAWDPVLEPLHYHWLARPEEQSSRARRLRLAGMRNLGLDAPPSIPVPGPSIRMVHTPQGTLLFESHRFGIGVREVARRQRPMIGLGVEVPPPPDPSVPDLVPPDPDDALLVDRLVAAASAPERRLAILSAAVRRLQAPDEIVRSLEDYGALGLLSVSELERDLGDMLQRPLSRDQLQALRRIPSLGVGFVWQGLAAAMKDIEMDIRDGDGEALFELCAWAAGLSEAEVEAARRAAIDRDDLRAISKDLDGQSPWLQGRVSASHVEHVARELHESEPEAVARIMRYADVLELTLESEGDDVDREDDAPMLVRLLEELVDIGEALGRGISAIDLAGAAGSLGRSFDSLADEVRASTRFSLAFPSSVVEALRGWTPTAADLILLSRDLDGEDPWIEAEVSALHLVRASLQRGEPVGAIYRHMVGLRPLVRLPDVSGDDLDALDDVVAERRDEILLSSGAKSNGDSIAGTVERLHVLNVSIREQWAIGDAVDRLALFAPLGLDLPPSEAGEWSDRIPDWQDLIVLSAELDGKEDLQAGPVSKRHLERAADAIQESAAAVAERLRAYTGLLGYRAD